MTTPDGSNPETNSTNNERWLREIQHMVKQSQGSANDSELSSDTEPSSVQAFGRSLQSALRVFVLAKVLINQGPISLVELQQSLDHHPTLNRTLSIETITHHLAILRAAGWPVVAKVESDGTWRYHLNHGAFRFGDISETGAASWGVLERFVSHKYLEQLLLGLLVQEATPSPSNKAALEALGYLQWGLPSSLTQPLAEHSNGLARLPESSLPNLQAAHDLVSDTMVFTWGEFYEWCQSGQIICIELNPNVTLSSTTMAPQQGISETCALDNRYTFLPLRREWHQCQWHLLGTDYASRTTCLIPVNAIQSAQITPQKVPTAIPLTAVTFQLQGRLAQTYRLYPEENIVEQTETTTTVRALTDNPWGLMYRLLRYTSQCTILSPKWFREEAYQHIQQLLNMLNSSPSRLHPAQEQPYVELSS